MQPWASLVGRGKHHETRSWATHYRGPIAIHAALRKPVITDLTEQTRKTVEHILGNSWRIELPLGAIIAVAHLAECLPTNQIETDNVDLLLGNFNQGRWAWKLTDIHILSDPLPCKGTQGLWNVPEQINNKLVQIERMI